MKKKMTKLEHGWNLGALRKQIEAGCEPPLRSGRGGPKELARLLAQNRELRLELMRQEHYIAGSEAILEDMGRMRQVTQLPMLG